MKVIVVANHKGGVGKTTATRNITGALSRKYPEKNILLVDADPQGNLSMAIPPTMDNMELMQKNNLYQAMKSSADVTPICLTPNIDIIPADIKLTQAEAEFAGNIDGFYLFNDILSSIDKEYDYIIIDTPPSLGLLSANAMMIADDVLIPVQADSYSLKGLNALLANISSIKKRGNKNIRVAGIFINIAKVNTQMHEVSLDWLEQAYPEYLMKTVIRQNTNLTKAANKNQDIFEYQESGSAAEDYMNFIEEYLNR